MMSSWLITTCLIVVAVQCQNEPPNQSRKCPTQSEAKLVFKSYHDCISQCMTNDDCADDLVCCTADCNGSDNDGDRGIEIQSCREPRGQQQNASVDPNGKHCVCQVSGFDDNRFTINGKSNNDSYSEEGFTTTAGTTHYYTYPTLPQEQTTAAKNIRTTSAQTLSLEEQIAKLADRMEVMNNKLDQLNNQQPTSPPLET